MIFLATNNPKRKNSNTARDVPFPLPNKDPINIKKNIIVEVSILKCIPITDPIIKKIMIKMVLPRPIQKWETKIEMYIDEYAIERLV